MELIEYCADPPLASGFAITFQWQDNSYSEIKTLKAVTWQKNSSFLQSIFYHWLSNNKVGLYLKCFLCESHNAFYFSTLVLLQVEAKNVCTFMLTTKLWTSCNMLMNIKQQMSKCIFFKLNRCRHELFHFQFFIRWTETF